MGICTGLGTSPPITSSGVIASTAEGPTPTVGAVASATVSMIPNTCTITNLSTGSTGGINTTAEMETKCTQTKLDDELEPPLILQTTNSNTTSETVIKPTAVSSVTGESNPGTVTTTGPSRSGSISAGPPKTGSVNEVRVPSTTGTAT